MTTIRFERDGAVGNIVLANPPKNLIASDFSNSLKQAVHETGESDIRALLVRAEGPNFSQGGDVLSTSWRRTRTSSGPSLPNATSRSAPLRPYRSRRSPLFAAPRLVAPLNSLWRATSSLWRKTRSFAASRLRWDLLLLLVRCKDWPSESAVRARHVTRCFANRCQA